MKLMNKLLVAAVMAVLSAAAAPAFAANQTVRPQVGKPLQEAASLIQKRRYRQALRAIQSADAVPKKTTYEDFMVDRMQLAAAMGAGDSNTAANALSGAIATGMMPKSDQRTYTRAIIDLYYRDGNYTQVINWANKYRKVGGSDSSLETLVAQAYYLKGDYANASRVLNDRVRELRRAGQTPKEQTLQLLASSNLKRHDKSGYVDAMRQLVTYYPQPRYWNDLIVNVQRLPDFSGHLSLDVLRLKLATGTLDKASEYMELAEEAVQRGYPLEAQQALKRGYDSKVLGKGGEAAREARLKALVDQRVEVNRKAMDSIAKQAEAQHDGQGMLSAGYNLVLNGKSKQGIALMRKAITGSQLKYPNEARLHLGLAYLKAGNRRMAIKVLKTVGGDNGAAELARLWTILIGQSKG